jgi:hypothetical protein
VRISGNVTSTTNPIEVTIASGAIYAIDEFLTVEGEGAASDILTTINGGSVGSKLTLMAADDAHTITVDDAADNILTNGGDFALDNLYDSITLVYNGTNWVETGRVAYT